MNAWTEINDDYMVKLTTGMLDALNLYVEGAALADQEDRSIKLVAAEKLETSGAMFSKQGNLTRTIECFELAAKLRELLGQKDAALDLLEKLLFLKRQYLVGTELADALLSKALAYDEAGYFVKSLGIYEDAAAVPYSDDVASSVLEATIRCGLLNARLNNDLSANFWFAKSLTLIEKSGRTGPLDLLKEMRKVSQTLPPASYAEIKSRIAIQTAKAFVHEATKLDEQNTASSKAEAVDNFLEAARIFEEAGDSHNRAKCLLSLGGLYNELGQQNSAVQTFTLALTIYDQLGDPKGQSGALTSLGRTLEDLGELRKALDCFMRSLQLRRELKIPYSIASNLSDLGRIFDALGQTDRALKTYEEALYLFEQLGDRSGISVAADQIGGIFQSHRKFKKALRYQFRSWENVENSDYKGIASSLHNLGVTYYSMGKNNSALWYFEKALEFDKKGLNEEGAARTLGMIGRIYFELGRFDEALPYFHESLQVFGRVLDPRGKARVLASVMDTWRGLGGHEISVFFGKQAVNIYQELRQNISGLDKETQKTYLKSVESTYRRLSDILIGEGRIAEAEQVLGMLKDEEYLSYLRRDDNVAKELKATIKLTPTEEEVFKRYEEIADEITRIGRESSELEKESKCFPVGKFPRQAEMDKLDEQLADARKVFNKFLEELDARFRNKETKAKDNRVAQISGTKALLDGLNQPRTVIISTIAGEDRLNLIVTTSKINRAHTVDIKAADLNKLVVEFRDAVKNPKVDPRPLGKKLFDVLFPADLQKDLAGVDADTIVWSFDGTLRYAPISALWDGEKFLVERYGNAIITLASRDKIDKTPAARTNWTALGLGVSQKFENFDALKAVPQELCRVVEDEQKKAACLKLTDGKTGVFGGTNLSDGEFTFENFRLHLGRYPIVHIASHFALNAGTESDSYLLLGGGKTSEERKLSISAVREKLDTKFVGTELLVLSTCNTAMSSGANSSGAEIEGFGALAQEQGAKTVLASLWAVADDSTRDLMTEFYEQLKRNQTLGKAAALRQSQIATLNGSYKTTGDQPRRTVVTEIDGETKQPKYETDPKAPFAHPFFWSPFVIMGNWQ